MNTNEIYRINQRVLDGRLARIESRVAASQRTTALHARMAVIETRARQSMAQSALKRVSRMFGDSVEGRAAFEMFVKTRPENRHGLFWAIVQPVWDRIPEKAKRDCLAETTACLKSAKALAAKRSQAKVGA